MSPSPPKPLLLLPLLLLLLRTTITEAATLTANATLPPSPSPTSSPTPPTTRTPSTSIHSILDPKQLRALQSMDIPTAKDPCIQPSPHNATICDSSSPFRHLVSLHLSNCSSDLALSYTALKSLSTLQSLSFTNCPVTPTRFPLDLALSLRSFTCIHSLKHLTGVGLSHFVNLTDLTVSNVPVNTSGLYVVLGNMHKLRSVTISNANEGYPSSITLLENLESLNLSSNALTGGIPSNFGDLISLKNVSLGSNSLSGAIPDSISAIPDLAHVDLSSNQLNGTIPKFFAEMKNLSLESPLVISMGLPMSPPPAKDDSSGDGSESDSSDYDDGSDDSSSKKEGHHGPNKVVLGLAIGLSSIVFLIVFLILLSKRCG
ncbi:hypothetical protein OIU77_009282 [Salix suchowensis]|uniref:Receptor-like protein 51 n=1 Tax=Salix suchowensis TaxID=1278906 RepID=A0ABQ9AFR7_9ROSI|nr:hypothetical protein OIU77_009282 [Salix suchowensis]